MEDKMTTLFQVPNFILSQCKIDDMILNIIKHKNGDIYHVKSGNREWFGRWIVIGKPK